MAHVNLGTGECVNDEAVRSVTTSSYVSNGLGDSHILLETDRFARVFVCACMLVPLTFVKPLQGAMDPEKGGRRHDTVTIRITSLSSAH